MAKNSEERATIVGRIILDEIPLAKLINLMRLFRDAVEYAHILLFREKLSEAEIKRKLTKMLSNAWYAYSAIKIAKLYKEQPKIKLRKPLLYSVGATIEKGNRNIRIIATDKILIKIPHADGKHEWIEAKVKFGRKYFTIIKELVSGNYSYGAGVTIKLRSGNEDWRKTFRNMMFLYLNIPLELYLKYFEKKVKVRPNNKLFAGFDFNVDRINMAIVDRYGRLRDTKNVHFAETVNYDKDKSKTVRQRALSELVAYAVAHGVKYFVIENLSKPRKIKGNLRKWTIREYTHQMHMLVKKVNGTLIKVNPAYTSVDAIGIAMTKGLDKHTASAYLIAIRGIKRHGLIQKTII